MSIFERDPDGAIATVRDQMRVFARHQDRRAVSVLAFKSRVLLAVDSRDFFAGFRNELDDLADGVVLAHRSVNQLQVERAVMENRC